MTNFAVFRHSIAARFIRLVRRFAGAAAIEDSAERERILLEAEKSRSDAVAAYDLQASVFARMNDGIVALDLDWRYTYVNDKAAGLLNRGKPADLVGKHIWTEYPDGVDQPFARAYRQAMETQQMVVMEEHYDPWDRWFENRIYPSPDGLTIYFTEITQRKHTEHELELLTQRLKLATDIAGIGILDWDLVTDRWYATPTYFTMLGYDPDEGFVDRKIWLERAHPEDREAVAAKIAALLAGTDTRYEYEGRIRHADGRYRWIHVVGRVVERDENGKAKRMLGVRMDITERKQVMEALRASEQKFAIAFRSSPDSITITAMADGRIVEVNEAGSSVMGYKREELIGQSTTALNLWVDEGDRKRYVAQLLEHGSVVKFEASFRKKSGEIRIGLMSGELIELEGMPYILAVIRDITERKRDEAEILKLNAELEQRVLERTAQLEAANNELEAFSYSVSHDLKAPLRGIDGYSQLLEENCRDSLGEEGRVFLHKIRQGAAQMHELIGDLLAYSRMERRSLENTALDLSSCVDAVVLAYTQQIAANGIVLQVDVPALTVHADRDGLAIALRNLLDNAFKFSRAADPPTIEIGARTEGGKVILWVRDNGIGFDMKFHDKVFEIFSRLQRSEDYPGTGVGLALVRKSMQRMGGRVWAESVPAQGSSFFLELNA